jgi:hypothetical protein
LASSLPFDLPGRYTLTMSTPKSSPLATLIIIGLALVLLFALNPTTAEFQAWRAARAQRQVGGSQSSGLIGVIQKGAGALAGAMTGIVSGAYERHDYLIFSTYSLGKNEYLGIARFFIELK